MGSLQDFRNKRVLIMGLGLHGGGAGAAAFFARAGARVTVTDSKPRRELLSSIRQLARFRGIVYRLGRHRADDFRNADYVIKNPGVRDDSRFLRIARDAEAVVLSDVEVFFRACPAPIIGVTGTKGKTTTTWLIGEFLKQETGNRGQGTGNKKRKPRVWVGGNIRASVLEFLPRVRKHDTVVLELSSFQLDSLAASRMSPEIAVITNIFPDHLNRYPSMRAYAASKTGIFRFQKPGDCLFVNRDDARLRRLVRRAAGRVVHVTTERVLRPFRLAIAPSVPAFHFSNIALAVAVAKHRGVGGSVIRRALRRFRGIPGRMELVRAFRGARYINDTTATNPTAAREAVRAVKRVIGRGRLIVIAGGFDKGLALGEFCRALRAHATAVILLPGQTSARMRRLLIRGIRGRGASAVRATPRRRRHSDTLEYQSVRSARTMAGAVRMAARAARPGDAVLLSPGAASFGLFQHEFDRGDRFAKAVKALR